MLDLRTWIEDIERAGQLTRVHGARQELEIGAISAVNYRKSPYKALLFDGIPGLHEDFKVLTGATGAAPRMARTLRLPTLKVDDKALVLALQGRPAVWEENARRFAPVERAGGPVAENVLEGGDVDLTRFPAPRWHEHDGGAYIGTGCAVLTAHPETGEVNVGCYRMMVQDARSVTVNIGRGKDGFMNIQKWWEREGKCPVVCSLGHDPLLFALAGLETPRGLSELSYAGAVMEAPVTVLKSDLTGLPIPTHAEIVLEGWLYPEKRAHEGPFGEWTGYYTDRPHHEPLLEVERVFYRDGAIVLGSPPGQPPHDFSYFRSVMQSAMILNDLQKAGVPEVGGVWSHEFGGGRQFIVVQITQRYCGHARQAGIVASQCRGGAYMGKYVVVVDEDIDPMDIRQVLWAMCFRCKVDEDIDMIRKSWGARVDPLCFDHERPYNARAIVDACVPFELKTKIPPVARLSEEAFSETEKRWGFLWT